MSKKQNDLPHMPPKSELTELCEKYCEHREELGTVQSNMETLKNRILDIMKKDKLTECTVQYDGEKYRFTRVVEETRLKVNKGIVLEKATD
jgi:hypothetical protein